MAAICKGIVILLTLAMLFVFFTSHGVILPFLAFCIWASLVVPFALVGTLFKKN